MKNWLMVFLVLLTYHELICDGMRGSARYSLRRLRFEGKILYTSDYIEYSGRTPKEFLSDFRAAVCSYQQFKDYQVKNRSVIS